MPDEMPPMDFQQQPDMGMMPPMNNMPMDNGQVSDFDTNFDAGVEADEDQDPKKYIQQLTGKLSQTLRSYNDNNGQPDVDLNKYVAGMIVKQAVSGLSPDDAEEIIDKVKADEDFSMDDNPDMPQGQNQQQMPQEPQMPTQGNVTQPNECAYRHGGSYLSEIINSVIHNDEDEKPYQESDGQKSFRKKPFMSPNFGN